MDGLEELALMRAHLARVHSAHQLRVLVDEPRLPQHVRRRVLQLQAEQGESTPKSDGNQTTLLSDACPFLSELWCFDVECVCEEDVCV